MSSVARIEAAVQQLDDAELAEFRSWFDEFLADAWDRQIDADAAAGRLDALGDEALADLKSGRCEEL